MPRMFPNVFEESSRNIENGSVMWETRIEDRDLIVNSDCVTEREREIDRDRDRQKDTDTETEKD